MLLTSYLRLPPLQLGLCLVVLGIIATGCQRDTRSVGRFGSGSGVTTNAERSQTLLDSAAGELADLPEQSILELRPPSIILDATKSSDGQDVEAELTTLSTGSRPLYNVLRVPARNARFKAIGVRSGDLVRWYANQQSELESEFGARTRTLSPEQMREIMKLPQDQRQEVADAMMREMQIEGDIVSTTAFEFKVDQVIDTNTLLVDLRTLSEDELARLPIDVPMRMEILRYRDSRFSDLVIDLNRYARRGVPRLGWEPSPDRAATRQIVERLNQWLRQTAATVEWEPAKLRSTLPQTLRESPDLALFLSDEALDRPAFSLATEDLRAIQAQGYEGRLLQEATWARDIGNWATESELETRGRIDQLFDWSVRTLQLEAPSDTLPPYRPWQSMIHGRATAAGRAWVFALLCRQQDVPVVVIRPGGEDGPLWCGAVLDGEILLYDPELGLPIVGEDGQTATLDAVTANPQLLESLDLEGNSYLPPQSDLKALTAQIVAGPFALSRRAALLESRLSGDELLLLAVDVDKLAADLEQRESIQSVVLWPHPYQVLADQLTLGRTARTMAALEFEPFVHKPRLWKARLLDFRGASGKTVDANRGNLETSVDDHRDAGRLYTHENIRPPQNTIEQLEADDVRRAWSTTKRNATYWLGLLSYNRGDYQVALNWLEKSQADEFWQHGATYNRARALEALGRIDEAIELLNSSGGPQSFGNRLRARRLENKISPAE